MARQTKPTPKELARATEKTLTEKDWVIDGVPAEITSVTYVEGELWINTNAGMYTKFEWHSKMCEGEIQRVN